MDAVFLGIHLPVAFDQQGMKVFQRVRGAPCPAQGGVQTVVGELAAQMLHKLSGQLLREIGSDQDKFIAAHPESVYIGGAGMAQALCHPAEQMVSRNMPLKIIDFLEAVEIQRNGTDLPA